MTLHGSSLAQTDKDGQNGNGARNVNIDLSSDSTKEELRHRKMKWALYLLRAPIFIWNVATYPVAEKVAVIGENAPNEDVWTTTAAVLLASLKQEEQTLRRRERNKIITTTSSKKQYTYQCNKRRVPKNVRIVYLPTDSNDWFMTNI